MFRKKRYIIGGIIILLALGYLGVTAFQDSATYYYTVSELYSQEADLAGDNIRATGTVMPGTIAREEGTNRISFTIGDGEKTISVSYEGFVPDAFKEDNHVVVEGELGEGPAFIAHTLIVKCPSKYEPAESGEGTE